MRKPRLCFVLAPLVAFFFPLSASANARALCDQLQPVSSGMRLVYQLGDRLSFGSYLSNRLYICRCSESGLGTYQLHCPTSTGSSSPYYYTLVCYAQWDSKVVYGYLDSKNQDGNYTCVSSKPTANSMPPVCTAPAPKC